MVPMMANSSGTNRADDADPWDAVAMSPARISRICSMAARRIIPAVSTLTLCLAACSSAGTAIGSSSGRHSAHASTSVAPHRTVVLDPSTGDVVGPGAHRSAHTVMLSPVTGQIVSIVH